jgi:hypothetical protein
MPTSEFFFCPECNAKLKFGRRTKPRVTCPRCGQEFDYRGRDEVADPFLADQIAESAVAAIPPIREDIDFGDEIVNARTLAEDDEYGQPPALPIRRASSSPVKKRNPEQVLKTQPRKRRSKSAALSRDAIWLYLAGAVLLALVAFVVIVIARPGTMFGRSLTPEEIAGTYVSENNPGLRLTFAADGTWEMDDVSQWVPISIGGLVYAIKGRKIICDIPEEEKVEPKQPIFIDRPFALRHRSDAERFITQFSDLTFEKGTLISPTKGRFKREPDPNAADPAFAAPGAAK